VVAWAQANQLREMAAFAHGAERDAVRHARERDARQISGEPVAPEIAQLDGLESAAAEISLMLRIAPVTANSRLDDALVVTTRHPATMAALAKGRITLCKARIIAEQTTQLSDAHAGAVEERVLDRAATQTPGQLRRSVRRAVTKADPAAVRRRHEAAKRERDVSFWELPDGMAMVSACLPAGEALGVYGILDEYARATGGADDRTLTARRADALVDLVCGSVGYLSTGNRTAEATSPVPSAAAPVVAARGCACRSASPCRSAPCSGWTSNLVSWPATERSPLSRPANWLCRAPGGASSPTPPPERPLITAPPSTDHRQPCAISC
jgi:hypothetical protein